MINPGYSIVLPTANDTELVQVHIISYYTVSQKNWAIFIFTVTLSNVGKF